MQQTKLTQWTYWKSDVAQSTKLKGGKRAWPSLNQIGWKRGTIFFNQSQKAVEQTPK